MIDSNKIFEIGARVWAWDPFVFGPISKAGKVIGINCNAEKMQALLNTPDVEYLVDFGKDGVIWISNFQITGWLEAVRGYV